MARIAGVEISDSAKLDWALTRIKGIGWTSSKKILKELKLEPKSTVGELKSDDLAQISTKLEGYLTEGDLVRQVRENVQRLRDINSYRGMRHSRGLPSRGQRTKSNARTKRGKRKTVGSFKKDILTKLGSDTSES